jgi:hypothetical protein
MCASSLDHTVCALGIQLYSCTVGFTRVTGRLPYLSIWWRRPGLEAQSAPEVAILPLSTRLYGELPN